MELAEFRKKVKNLAVNNGLKKNDVSVTAAGWLSVRISCNELELYTSLKKKIEEIAGFKNNSDVMTDYFDYDVNVINKNNGKFGGLLISRNY